MPDASTVNLPPAAMKKLALLFQEDGETFRVLGLTLLFGLVLEMARQRNIVKFVEDDDA